MDELVVESARKYFSTAGVAFSDPRTGVFVLNLPRSKGVNRVKKKGNQKINNIRCFVFSKHINKRSEQFQKYDYLYIWINIVDGRIPVAILITRDFPQTLESYNIGVIQVQEKEAVVNG